MSELSCGAKAGIAFVVIVAIVILIFIIVYLVNSCSSSFKTPTTTEGKAKLSKEIASAATLEGEMSEDELDFDF